MRRLDLLQIAVSQTLRVNRLALNVDVSQWVPLVLQKRNLTNDPGTYEDSDQHARSGKRSWNGFRLALSIVAAF